MKTTLNSIKEMEVFAGSFTKEIITQENKSKALVLGLKGNLGAGKTAFAKSVAKALGVEGTVTSPTFVIEKIYKLPKLPKLPQREKFSHLIHIDAYRLESGKELLELGWEEIVNDPKNLILIEWPEMVADVLSEDVKIIKFKFIDESTREVEY